MLVKAIVAAAGLAIGTAWWAASAGQAIGWELDDIVNGIATERYERRARARQRARDRTT